MNRLCVPPSRTRTARFAYSTRIAIVLVLTLSPALHAEDEDEEFFPGLAATYSAGSRSIERVDSDITFDWGADSPDSRLESGRFLAEWTGLLLLKSATRYQFHAYLRGDLTVEVDGKPVLAASRRDAGWVSGTLVALPFGEQPFRVSYRRTGPGAIVKLFWSSDAFALEPVPEHLLFHEFEKLDLKVIERGRVFFDRLRCNRCHRDNDDVLSAPGPSLTHIGGMPAGDLIARIERPAVESGHGRMPRFGFTRDETTSIAAYLLSVAETPKLDPPAPPKAEEAAKIQEAGGTLFRSLGCLVCHTMDGEPVAAYDKRPGRDSNDLTTGGDLSDVATKRSADWLATWLRDPAGLNADHQMPVYRLSDAERRQLVAFLTAKPAAPVDPAARVNEDELQEAARIAKGKELIAKARCAACHRIPGIEAVLAGVPSLNRPGTGWQRACLAGKADSKERPAYETHYREAIGSFLAAHAGPGAPQSALERGQQLVERRQCTACHERGTTRGLAAFAGEISGGDPALKGQSEALIPPALSAVGDKLTDAALAEAVTGGFEKPRLPWLRVRMPKFAHTPQEKADLVRYFVAKDRIPDGAPRHNDAGGKRAEPEPLAKNARPSDAALAAARLLQGEQLVGPRGFSCIACHEIGPYKPKNVALGTRGSDLLKLGSRMRKEFYVRWTRSPARIVPGMEMPSYIKAVPGLLGEDIDAQLSATWDALNDPRFTPPTNPVAVEQFLVVGRGQPPRLVRDVFATPAAFGTKVVPRSFAVGLNSGHNVLFDLETTTLRQWTFGDFARQRTEGKSWYWELAGSPVVAGCSAASDFALESATDPNAPLRLPDVSNGPAGRLLDYRVNGVACELRYEVHFPPTDSQPAAILVVSESLAPTHDGARSGFVRTIEATGLPAGWRLRVAAHHSDGALGRGTIRRADPEDAQAWSEWPVEEKALPEGFARRGTVALTENGTAKLTLRYEAELKAADLPLPVKPVLVPPAEAVTTVPGYDGVRLPLDRSIMPTGLAWTSDGSLCFTSLKGHVYRAERSRADGPEDSLTLLEEGLAAPYGLLADGEDLLVSHKPEILRLKRVGRSPAVEEAKATQREVFAAGWGYSDNYHDWTCGLVRDARGNYYVGTGSDYAQDKRSKRTGKWRGKVLRISPQGEVEPVAHALRYPTGLAFDSEGRLFATDNQGVQNTFNELNHIVQGRSYGVPARFEETPDAPARPPAVQIPHPWTRSVNGVAFLPRGEAGGPFAGHGIGCDYDTRSLVRFTIQEVDGVVQGAAYSFSLPEQGAGGKNFTGPLAVAVDPNGDIYVGSIHDSGWLGGLNTGDITRLRANGKLPNGIREVRTTPTGFEIDFIHPVDATLAGDAGNYTISGYTRVWKGSYATPDSGRHSAEIESVKLSEDGRRASLKIKGLKEGFVYDIACRNFGDPAAFFPAEAHYTLHRRPE